MTVHRHKSGIPGKFQPREVAVARSPRRAPYIAFLAAILPMAGMLLPDGAARAEGELGTWLTDDQKAKIELRECGESGLCSKIVWLKDPVDEKGQPWHDELNPNPAKRGRSIIGIDILKGLKKVENKTWSGEIYDPEEGKFYYLKRIVVRPDKVEIRGCLSSGWPCRSKYWTRTAPVRPPEPVQVAKREQPATAAMTPQPRPARQTAQLRQAPAPRPVQRAEAAPAPKQQVEASAAASIALPTPAPAPAAPQPQARREAAAQPPMPQARPAPAQRQAAPVPAARTAAAPAPQPRRRETAPWQPERRYANAAPSATGSLPPPAVAPGGLAYLVQVTAGQDQNEALRTFGKLQSRYPHLLGGYLPNIQKVDLGERGVWYRVRVGPLGPQTAASSFCQQLKAAGADCLIRRQ